MTVVEPAKNSTAPPDSPSTDPESAPIRGPVAHRPGISYHLGLLVLCSVVVTLSLVMSTRGTEQVVVPVLNRPLPGLCMSKSLFGLDCPGCGMTRCFISVAHGDLPAAWGFNPVGLLFFALVASQIPLRAIQIWRIKNGRPEWEIGRWQWPLFLIVGLMLLQWIVKTSTAVFG